MGEQKVKGHLRLDTYDRLMRGGSDGAIVVPGKPERSTLVAAHHSAAGRQEIYALRRQAAFEAGGDRLDQSLDSSGSVAGAEDSGPASTCPITRSPCRKWRTTAEMMGEIAQAAKSAGVTLVPVSRNLGDGLILNTVDAGANSAMPNWQAWRALRLISSRRNWDVLRSRTAALARWGSSRICERSIWKEQPLPEQDWLS